MMAVANPTIETQKKVTLMLQSNEKIIKHKVGLLNLAEELGNVSKACQIMGLSRDTFYRYRDAVEDGGVEALLERPRRAPNLAKVASMAKAQMRRRKTDRQSDRRA